MEGGNRFKANLLKALGVFDPLRGKTLFLGKVKTLMFLFIHSRDQARFFMAGPQDRAGI